MTLAHPRPALTTLALACLLWLVACRPDLDPGATGAGGGGGAGGAGGAELSIEPVAPPDRVPLVARFRLEASQPIDRERVHWVAGPVGPGHLRQLAAGDPSAALEARLLPASVWSEDGAVVVAPHDRLAPSERHAVALADRGLVFELTSEDAPTLPELTRWWPPVSGAPARPPSVLCGGALLPEIARTVGLGPSREGARVERGAVSSGAGHRCVRFLPAAAVADGTALQPPPSITIEGATWALDPRPLVVGPASESAPASASCLADEVPFALGCARFLDDRAHVRTPDTALLWVVSGPGIDRVWVTSPGEPMVVLPLEPSSDVTLAVTAVDVSGRETTAAVQARTLAPRPHVVLNEILADSIAPEPRGEWIEIVNDGRAPARLADLVLVDVGGEVALPDVELAPGAFALLVSESWAPDPAIEPSPPPGALVLKLPRLGLGGLANGGELLRLVDGEGQAISAVPPIASGEHGESVARRSPGAADGLASFVVGPPTPAAPNGLAEGDPSAAQ